MCLTVSQPTWQPMWLLQKQHKETAQSQFPNIFLKQKEVSEVTQLQNWYSKLTRQSMCLIFNQHSTQLYRGLSLLKEKAKDPLKPCQAKSFT